MTISFKAAREAIEKNRKLAKAYLCSLGRASLVLKRLSALKAKNLNLYSDLFDIKLPPEIRFEVRTSKKCAETLRKINCLPQQKPPVTIRLLWIPPHF